MAIGTWQQPNFQTQTGTVYKTAIDNSIAVAERLARAFAVHELATPGMGVIVDPGAVQVGNSLIERAAQTLSPIVGPVTNPRIDRIYYDAITGNALHIQGTEAVSPVPPTIPGSGRHLARVNLAVGQTEITNLDITDERISGSVTSLEILDGGVNKVTRTTSVGFTDVDISGDTGGDFARFAILQVRGVVRGGESPGGPNPSVSIVARFRKNGSSATAALPRFELETRDSGLVYIKSTQTIIVRCDESQIFEYDFTVTINNAGTGPTHELVIDIVGFLR